MKEVFAVAASMDVVPTTIAMVTSMWAISWIISSQELVRSSSAMMMSMMDSSEITSLMVVVLTNIRMAVATLAIGRTARRVEAESSSSLTATVTKESLRTTSSTAKVPTRPTMAR